RVQKHNHALHGGARQRIAYAEVAEVFRVFGIVVEGEFRKRRVELVAVVIGADGAETGDVRVGPDSPLVLEAVIQREHVGLDLVADNGSVGVLVGRRVARIDQEDGPLCRAGRSADAAGRVGVKLHVNPAPAIVVDVLSIHGPGPAGGGADIVRVIFDTAVPDR